MDELPDLTPYLNKKGGNSQGRGEENPAGKTDLSQKLSALVKKPGSTGTHPSVQAALNAQAAQEAGKEQPPSGGDRPAAGTSGQEARADSEPTSTYESAIGIIKPQAPPAQSAADNQGGADDPSGGSNGQETTSSASGSSAVSWSNLAQGPDSTPSASPVSPVSSPEPPLKDSAARWGELAALGGQPWSSSASPQGAAGQGSDSATASDSKTSVPGGSSPPAVPRSEDNYAPSPSREMARPGQPPDKLKGPQSKPMSTLSSSSAPPLLKTPPKEPGRPAQPYSFRPAVEPGREAMAPRGPSSAPVNRGPQPVSAPRPAMPQPANSVLPNVSPPSPPASTPEARPLPAPPRPEPPVQPQPQAQPSSQPRSPVQPLPQVQPSAPRAESDAEKLARAFMEEARALQDIPQDSRQDEAPLPAPNTNSGESYSIGKGEMREQSREQNYAGDYEGQSNSQKYANQSGEFQPASSNFPGQASAAPAAPEPKPATHAPREAGPKASLSSLFDSGVLSSKGSDQSAPSKPIGFGSLLAGAPTADEKEQPSTLADLMVPTGEHNTLFAPDRREPSETSAFDEITAQVNADHESVIESLSGGPLSQSPPDQASVRLGEKSQAPAFSSLFSSEIVTSGQDFSDRDNAVSLPASSFTGTAGDTDSDLLEPSANELGQESRVVNPKSLAISKLIEAVNQGESKDFSSNTDDTKSDQFSSEVSGVGVQAEDANAQAPGLIPDIGALSPSALEALAAFCAKGRRGTTRDKRVY
jgi:hypothetical protein